MTARATDRGSVPRRPSPRRQEASNLIWVLALFPTAAAGQIGETIEVGIQASAGIVTDVSASSHLDLQVPAPRLRFMASLTDRIMAGLAGSIHHRTRFDDDDVTRWEVMLVGEWHSSSLSDTDGAWYGGGGLGAALNAFQWEGSFVSTVVVHDEGLAGLHAGRTHRLGEAVVLRLGGFFRYYTGRCPDPDADLCEWVPPHSELGIEAGISARFR